MIEEEQNHWFLLPILVEIGVGTTQALRTSFNQILALGKIHPSNPMSSTSSRSYLPRFHAFLPFVNDSCAFRPTFLVSDIHCEVTHRLQCLLDMGIVWMLGTGPLQQFVQLQWILTDALNRCPKKIVECQLSRLACLKIHHQLVRSAGHYLLRRRLDRSHSSPTELVPERTTADEQNSLRIS